MEALHFDETVVNFIPKGINLLFPNLKVLDIWKCGLLKISKTDLDGFEQLQVLSLGYNQLHSIPNDLFDDMKNLKAIFLIGNPIEYMS